MKVPFIDLKAQYTSIRDEMNLAIQEVLDSSLFSGGPFVEKFEEEFAQFCQSNYCIGVGSGTEALWLIMIALGIGQGDEVITAPNTFIATAEAISYCGAKPVFVDVDDQTYTINPSLLEAAITSRTKAIIPVHLFGHMADMDPIMEIAIRKGLYVIEDACQAHGALYKGRQAGSVGDAAAFSFYPSKNLGAYGEAGAVVTSDENLAKRIRLLRNHGQPKKYYHDHVGWNGRMDGVQAAILRVKLSRLPTWNEKRRAIAATYHALLAKIPGVGVPQTTSYCEHVFHVYSVRVPERDRLLTALTHNQIDCSIHYPVPVHLQKAYAGLSLTKGSFPVSERCAEEFLSLPMFPELTSQQIEFVAEVIRSAL